MAVRVLEVGRRKEGQKSFGIAVAAAIRGPRSRMPDDLTRNRLLHRLSTFLASALMRAAQQSLLFDATKGQSLKVG